MHSPAIMDSCPFVVSNAACTATCVSQRQTTTSRPGRGIQDRTRRCDGMETDPQASPTGLGPNAAVLQSETRHRACRGYSQSLWRSGANPGFPGAPGLPQPTTNAPALPRPPPPIFQATPSLLYRLTRLWRMGGVNLVDQATSTPIMAMESFVQAITIPSYATRCGWSLGSQPVTVPPIPCSANPLP